MLPRRTELALTLLMFALPAQAREVARDVHGGVLNLSGFYKTVLSGFLLQPDAVAAARVNASLLESAGVKVPVVPEGAC